MKGKKFESAEKSLKQKINFEDRKNKIFENLEKIEIFKNNVSDIFFLNVKLPIVFTLMFADENFEHNGQNYPSFFHYYNQEMEKDINF